MRLQPVVAFALLVALVALVRASAYTYDYGYASESDETDYDDFGDFDDYNYYGDDDEELYNDEGEYANMICLATRTTTTVMMKMTMVMQPMHWAHKPAQRTRRASSTSAIGVACL